CFPRLRLVGFASEVDISAAVGVRDFSCPLRRFVGGRNSRQVRHFVGRADFYAAEHFVEVGIWTKFVGCLGGHLWQGRQRFISRRFPRGFVQPRFFFAFKQEGCRRRVFLALGSGIQEGKKWDADQRREDYELSTP